MTTAPERPAATVEDVTHPDWCELATCEPRHGVLDFPSGGLHYSRGTMWPSYADNCENTVRLVHSDDYDRAGRNDGSTRVQLIIRQTEVESPDGSAIEVDTWLDPQDARMLAAALTRYADLAERDNARDGAQDRYPAAEVRSAQR
ncbi:hypothetical protein [Nocardioides sp. CFH 31398]|uniref:hypothetical protein n=1 Tax=Nocardioides sp. CFH 31398 TaxID=2919579 RepID=UPI001F060B51|nr:hypothetical protein [Nocardioides sp. CFH 31398]MCH1867095.1 hypothetical protein [Nocardioides sp. CFH 31398]